MLTFNRPSIRSRQKQKGFSSVEMGLVLLVVALLVVAAVYMYRDNLRRTSVNNNMMHLTSISGALRSVYGQANQYANVTTAIAVSGAVVPKSLRNGTATTATNTFGGTIEIAPATLTSANDAIQITWPNVASDQCQDIVMGVVSEMRKVQVAGSDVKPLDGQINLGTLTTQCDSSPNVTLNFFVGRS